MRIVTVKRFLMFILLFFLFNIQNLHSPTVNISIAERVNSIEYQIKAIQWYQIYELIVQSIKMQEGFMPYKYYCPAGFLTIGYGHKITEQMHFYQPVSQQEAEELLRKDLDSAINFVRNTTNLNHIQLLSIAHLVYNIGVGNFYNSTLRQLILQNKPIDDEIIKWIHFRAPSGTIIRSTHLLQSRKFELNLFNSFI